MKDRQHFFFLNVGHFLDHLVMLIFATVAALELSRVWGMSYAQLLPYATPGFIAFAIFALPAGWLADRWSREGMMTVYFIGTGIACMFAALASTPLQMAFGLFAIGVFAAIYHPVGIALVLEQREKAGMAIAINGVWGNMGVAVAALLTAWFIDNAGWRSAFVWPGAICAALGVAYALTIWRRTHHATGDAKGKGAAQPARSATYDRDIFVRVIAIIMFTTGVGGLVFQSTTFALPKIMDERLADVASSATMIGWAAFIAFAAGAVGQLVVGYLVDRVQPRFVFMGIAALQVAFFSMMPATTGWLAVAVAIGFMFAAFGQIPINDVLVKRIVSPEWRSRVLAIRYVVTLSVIAMTLPLIAWIHANWGFDRLFLVLSIASLAIFAATLLLPRAIPARSQPVAAE